MKDTYVTWLPVRPEFTIECEHGRSTSTNRGYHESFYKVVSRHSLDNDAFAHLDACGLLGTGQAFCVEGHAVLIDVVQPVTIECRTGRTLDMPPVDWRGQPITRTMQYDYHSYVVRRICDSGD